MTVSYHIYRDKYRAEKDLASHLPGADPREFISSEIKDGSGEMFYFLNITRVIKAKRNQGVTK